MMDYKKRLSRAFPEAGQEEIEPKMPPPPLVTFKLVDFQGG